GEIGNGDRPERRHARRGPHSRRGRRPRRPGRAARRTCRVTAVRRRAVRRADVHVSLALRRRPLGDARRTCTRHTSGRRHGNARVRGAARAVAPALGALRPDRLACCWSRPRGRLRRGRAIPRRQYSTFLGTHSGAGPHRPLARRRPPRRSSTPTKPRRRHRRVGRARVSNADTRPAFYALRPGAWRDFVTLLHPPYTLWHLSYVALGAGLAPQMKWGLLGWTELAFFLAMGIGAHALDELNGRPLRTSIPDTVLLALAAVSIAGACAIGLVIASGSTWWLLVFILSGVFIVLAYNLELFGGMFHGDLGFAGAWGAFPVLTAYFAAAERIRIEAVLAASFALLSSLAQRTLSTPVRAARRRGDDPAAARPAELALKLLALAMPILAGALLAARSG